VYGLAHRVLEKGDRADTVNLQGSTLTTKAKLALGRGEATAGAERRFEEFDGVAALRAEPAANFTTASAAWRKEQIEESSFNTKDKVRTYRCQPHPSFLSAPGHSKRIGKMGRASGCLSDLGRAKAAPRL